jgi:hypothetical protein
LDVGSDGRQVDLAGDGVVVVRDQFDVVTDGSCRTASRCGAVACLHGHGQPGDAALQRNFG